MATLQVFIGNKESEDPKRDALLWKEGDIIAVHEDGVCKEPPAPGSRTAFIHLPGISAANLNSYLEPEYSEVIDGPEVTTRPEVARVIKRRSKKLDLARLPTRIRQDLLENKPLEVNTLEALQELTLTKQRG